MKWPWSKKKDEPQQIVLVADWAYVIDASEGEIPILSTYLYNRRFKLYGAEGCTSIACGYDRDKLLRETKYKLKGRYEVIEVLEIMDI